MESGVKCGVKSFPQAFQGKIQLSFILDGLDSR